MNWTYFNQNYATMNALREHYRRLCMELHPDKHQDNPEHYTELFKAMRAEYETFLEGFIPGQNQQRQANNQHDFNIDAESDLADVIADLMKYPGLIIEICGSWIWLTGNTYSVKGNLKNLGFRWQHKKQSWYFAGYDFKPKKSKIMSMDHIRNKYGSMTLETEQRQSIA